MELQIVFALAAVMVTGIVIGIVIADWLDGGR